QPLPLEGGLDLGMDKHDGARLRPVLDEPGTGRSDPELIAQLLGVVDDPNVHLRHRPRVPLDNDDASFSSAAPSRACSGRNAAACWDIPPAQTGLTVAPRCRRVGVAPRGGRGGRPGVTTSRAFLA